MSKLNALARKGAVLFTAAAIITGAATETSAKSITAKQKLPTKAATNIGPDVFTTVAPTKVPVCSAIGSYLFETTIVAEEPVLNGFVLWALPGTANQREAVNYSRSIPVNEGGRYLETKYNSSAQLATNHQAFELWLGVQRGNYYEAESSRSPIRIDLSKPVTEVVIWMGGSAYNTAKVTIRHHRWDC